MFSPFLVFILTNIFFLFCLSYLLISSLVKRCLACLFCAWSNTRSPQAGHLVFNNMELGLWLFQIKFSLCTASLEYTLFHIA
uniref:Uncharacterized protein n=1 Tax=Rhizophora mucronata TaxID=61149 RepID=A0A2P2MLH3_RHIMU